MTRSPYGLWVFADALAKARQAWLRALGAQDGDDDDLLFSLADDIERLIESEQRYAVAILTANLRDLAGREVALKLVEHARDVFGEAYGVATEPAVTKALRALMSSGELVVYKNAARLRDRVVGCPRRA